MAPAPVKVWPTKASALNVKHPHGPQMTLVGVFWPNDSFTARRLVDGSATKDESQAYVPPKAEEAKAPEPVSSEPGTPAPASAGVPFMITAAMREQLRARGISDETVAQMTPKAAHAELSQPVKAD